MGIPFVTIILDRPRRLRYGMAALARLEQVLGKKITELDTAKLGIADLQKVLWAGLVDEDRELTPERVAELVDEYGTSINDMFDAVSRALAAAFGVTPVAEGGAKNPQKEAGTGTKPSE